MLYYDTFMTAILAGNDPFLTETPHSKQKKIIQPKYMIF